MTRRSRIVIATAALALMATGPAPAQEVGKASAVNPAATANLRTITIGSSIAHKERIKTAAEGSVQILFVDKTSMTIGPNSDLTIDEYVYNPNAGTGKLAATLGKGALRFVGGQISHSGDAEIKTASAVIGIRGGVALISTQNVYAGYGTSTVTSGGASVTLGAGEFTQTAGGQPPSLPAPPPPGFVANLIQSFQSASGQTGGAPSGAATPLKVARAEARATGSNGGAVAGQLTPPVVNTPVAPLTNSTTSALVQTVQTTTQSTAVQVVTHETPPTTLTGYVGGLMRSTLGERSGVSGLIGLANVILNPLSGRVQANFNGAIYSEHEGAYAPQTFAYQYGFQDGSENPQSQYVDSRNFSAQPAFRRNGEAVSTIDSMPITNQTGEMRTVTAAEARQYAWSRNYDLTACECDYTRWGIWTSGSRQNVDGSVYTDLVSGFWVAGRPVSASDVPTVGTASYAGHVVANVQNGTNSYLAGGNLTTTVNFANRSGTAQVANFDGVNYAGALVINPTDPRNLYSGLAATSGDRGMVLTGQFFRGATSPVGEMGGSAVVVGSNYLGSGIFAARMK